MSDKVKKLVVLGASEGPQGVIWTRAGSAYLNEDGTITVQLDVLPISGMLHVKPNQQSRVLH